MNKRKILNDPVHGFITIPYDILFDLIEHPYFQRLRRIKQLGLTDYVYPGAQHTRFHHAIGAMSLMMKAVSILRIKGHEITEEEEKAAMIAILLHDIGHGPFSHTLEHILIPDTDHETISMMYMQALNKEFSGKLDLAISIFKNEYSKQYLNQLISSQLDVDRLDYLARDSFYTGVSEGVVNYNRIIQMMNVVDGNLVIEEKGIYSIEKFLIARRLMYWQVYLHKAVIGAEMMLIQLMKRAKELIENGIQLSCSPSLANFFYPKRRAEVIKKGKLLDSFSQLDDYDIVVAMKEWQHHEDSILSTYSKALLYRKLFKIELDNTEFDKMDELKQKGMQNEGWNDKEAEYFVFSGRIEGNTYNANSTEIKIASKSGIIKNIGEASDQLSNALLNQPVVKYYMCYPKSLVD